MVNNYYTTTGKYYIIHTFEDIPTLPEFDVFLTTEQKYLLCFQPIPVLPANKVSIP